MIRPRPLPLLALALVAARAGAEDVPLRTPPDRPIDVRRIALDLGIDLERRQVEGTATLDVVALTGVGSVRLDAVGHEVQAVTRVGPDGGAGASLPFAYDGQALTIQVRLERKEAASLRVAYRVRDPEDGLYFFGPTPDAPDVPWQVWSQGESITNRHWFPCVDHPDERQATSLTARVKKGLTVVSNGTLVETADEPGGTGRTVWRFEQEREHVSYLVTLVVGTFDVVEETWRGKRVAYYVPVGRKQDVARSFDRTRAMLDFFSEATGVEYPWPKYEQVVVEQFEMGGMENTGATTLNERTLHDARAHLDYSSEGLVAHELAHQWFGDLITCRDWAHIWLNESFATYLDALWVEKSKGRDEYDLEMLDNAEGGIHGGRDRPIVDRRWPTPDSMFDGRAYPKGASVLHQLRRGLGDEAWWRGLRLYVARHQDSSVETVALRRAFEEASGRSLERFFTDWTERPGTPNLDVSFEHDAERGLLIVTVQQTQAGEAWELPVELLVRQVGGTAERHSFVVREKRERLFIACRAAPDLLVLDPDEALILCERTVHLGRDQWLAQLRDGPTAASRVRAARALGEDRSPPVREALARAMAQDAVTGVRVAAAAALGKNGDDAARDALLAGLKLDQPKVRLACVDALAGRGKDAAVAKAFTALLEEGDASYYVEAAAVRGLPRVADDVRRTLEAQLAKPSHNEVIRLAALEALGGLGDPTLVPFFLEQTAAKHDYGVRQTAARALGATAGLAGCSDEQRKAAVEALKGMLSLNRRGRRAALDGLSALGRHARPALAAVEVLERNETNGGLRRRAKEVADRIRADAPPEQELARLREETRTLREAKERLEERLEKLEAQVKAQQPR